MNALRITRPTVFRSLQTAAALCILTAAFGLLGCGTATPPTDETQPAPSVSPGTNDPIWLTSRGRLPAPDCDRIEYNPRERALTFHPLPAGDRWMVQLPDEENARYVGPFHQLPEGVDTSRTLVYYSRPGTKISAPVSVAQIEAGRLPHTSQARNP
jgi:hypothetical protein